MISIIQNLKLTLRNFHLVLLGVKYGTLFQMNLNLVNH